MAFVKVASATDVPEGELLGVEAGGKRICLANVEGEVYAFADNCSHREFPLSNGELDSDDCTVTCEWHGAMFDIRSGTPLCLPATRPIAVYGCKRPGGDIWGEVEAEA